MSNKECHEEVTRQGEFDACGKIAVAFRIDPVEGRPYPVCSRHCRGDMVPLTVALESLPTPPVAGEPDLIEEFSFDYEPMPGLKYVTTNAMLVETMAAAKPGAKVLRRLAPKWTEVNS
jgi:hypothetical protein